jgi:hypothetical protein
MAGIGIAKKGLGLLGKKKKLSVEDRISKIRQKEHKKMLKKWTTKLKTQNEIAARRLKQKEENIKMKIKKNNEEAAQRLETFNKRKK